MSGEKQSTDINISTFLINACQQVNDIHDQVYFIYKGQVEVLGPDRNRMCLLPEGSMFGILDRCGTGRQTLTMVAKGNVELLSISSNDFHNILVNYKKLQEQFIKHTLINVDYIPGGPLLPMQQNLQKGRYKQKMFTRIIIPASKSHKDHFNLTPARFRDRLEFSNVKKNANRV